MRESQEEAARRGTRDGAAARSSRPPRSSWEEGPTEDRESVYTTLRVRIRVTRAPACSNEKENYLKITCCSLR